MASAEELTQRARDLEVIETEEQDDAVIDGVACTGCFTEFTRTDTNEIGGYVPDYDASFYVRTSFFTGTRPNKESTVIVTVAGQAKSFIVQRVHNYPDDIAMELELRSEAQ